MIAAPDGGRPHGVADLRVSDTRCAVIHPRNRSLVVKLTGASADPRRMRDSGNGRGITSSGPQEPRRRWRTGGGAIAVLLALLHAASGVAAQDLLGAPAMATSEDPDSMVVSPTDPSTLVVGSEALGTLGTPTRALPSPVEALLPVIASSESPGALSAAPADLDTLPSATQVEATVRRQVGESVAAAEPDIAVPTSLAVAEASLDAARARLSGIDSAIGTMIRRDYPTGTARLRLYDEQSAARSALARAVALVRDFGGSSGETN